MAGQRSNGLKDVPGMFSFHYWKSANLQSFLRFKRFACVSRFNPIEPNSEVNGYHGHHAKPPVHLLKSL